MADVSNYSFQHQEVVTALIKAQNLHEGLWQLSINFGLAAATVGDNPKSLVPAAIVGVTTIGLQRATELNGLTVDAAVANPASK